MPKGPKGQKRPANMIGNAITVAKIATGEWLYLADLWDELVLTKRSGRTATDDPLARSGAGRPHWSAADIERAHG